MTGLVFAAIMMANLAGCALLLAWLVSVSDDQQRDDS